MCEASPCSLLSVTPVISISREPQRPSSDARHVVGVGRVLLCRPGVGGLQSDPPCAPGSRLFALTSPPPARARAPRSCSTSVRYAPTTRLGSPAPRTFPLSSQSASSQKRSTRFERVRHQQNRLAAPLELAELVEALVREALVADREHFVDEQDIGIDVNRHGKPEPHVHAGRVRLDRRVDEFLQLGELDDLVEPPGDFALGQAEHDAVDEDVLAARDFRMKSGAQLDERRDAPFDLHGPASSAS